MSYIKWERFPGVILVLVLIAACHTKEEGRSSITIQEPAHGIENPFGQYYSFSDSAVVASLMEKGIALQKSNADSAMLYYQQAYHMSKAINFHRGTALSLLNMGNVFKQYKGFAPFQACYQYALIYCRLAEQENPDLYLVADVYRTLGNAYFHECNNDSAMKMYLFAADAVVRKKPIDTLRLAQLYNNIGSAMEPMDDGHQRAMSYYNKALQLALSSARDTALLTAAILTNIGAIYIKRDQNDSALSTLQRALTQYRSVRDTATMQKLYASLSDVWLHKGNSSLGKAYLDSALALDQPGMVQQPLVFKTIAHIYYHQGDIPNSIRYAEKALALFKGPLEKSRLFTYVMLARMYDTIGQGHEAFLYARAYAQLQDSILDDDKIKSLNQIEVKFRTAEKDKDIIQKQLLIARQKNRIQQQYLWIGATVLTIFLLLGIFFRWRHKATVAELKANLAGEEKERIRMAGELHDGIVSKLSSVKMSFDALRPTEPGPVIHPEEFGEALQLLEQSIIELRTTSQNLQPSILQRAGLIAATRIYCQKVCSVNSLDLDFQVLGQLPELQSDFQLHIYRMVQELINNIVKHAQASQALLQLNIYDEHLHITVEDNGIGVDPEKLHNATGIGWHNLQNRLKLLNGKMSVESRKGTTVYLDFALREYMIS